MLNATLNTKQERQGEANHVTSRTCLSTGSTPFDKEFQFCKNGHSGVGLFVRQCQYYTWHARPPGDYLGQVGKALGAGCGRKGAPVIKHGSQFLVTRWSQGCT